MVLTLRSNSSEFLFIQRIITVVSIIHYSAYIFTQSIIMPSVHSLPIDITRDATKVQKTFVEDGSARDYKSTLMDSIAKGLWISKRNDNWALDKFVAFMWFTDAYTSILYFECISVNRKATKGVQENESDYGPGEVSRNGEENMVRRYSKRLECC